MEIDRIAETPWGPMYAVMEGSQFRGVFHFKEDAELFKLAKERHAALTDVVRENSRQMGFSGFQKSPMTDLVESISETQWQTWLSTDLPKPDMILNGE